MILCDTEIRAALASGAIRIDPLPEPEQFTSSALDLMLSLPPQSRIAARVEGRSTLARLGLVIHLTAPIIHAGFSGIIALEMYHFGPHPLRLWPGRHSICQLVFERVGGEPEGGIRTTYQGQTGVR